MAGNQHCSCSLLGEWIKGKVIGSGSFGTDHLAMNKASGSLFVVKSAESGAGIQALENEADILESLNLPYIILCLGRSLSNKNNGEGTLDVFMEYMAGGSLSDVAEKFGGALDSECKNVLLGSNGKVKLADFGCSKRLLNDRKISNGESIHSWKSIGGSPLWMAPEVLRNEGLDFASDIWSLGCLVIEMATGIPPWNGLSVSNPMAAVLKIACGNEKPQLPTGFSQEGLDFLEKCLERNQEQRWTAEELLNHPYISGKFPMNSRKECACSPSSILDFRIQEGGYDSDETRDEFPGRNPFSNRCFKRKTGGRE
ncbi:hypothetical protein Dsin_030790 [Dipteronia sinensis]|uniref:Protein kinase domain-containing protein n=1 Tax=Dipteronia sinensis TaxID=43782 RepID=A0AAD9ZLL1_9ROSI|nr:hypothetical protein Dsin_030790 [Dipteronia sinensis]